MTDFNVMMREQYGRTRPDGYPNILPPRTPVEAAPPPPKDPWWFNVWVGLTAAVKLQVNGRAVMNERGLMIYRYLIERQARVAK